MAIKLFDQVSGWPAVASTSAEIDLTVVVPLYNEVDNIDPAVTELLEALDAMPEIAEVILVDDGSHDGTGLRALRWHERDARVRVIQFRRNFGQTAAISAGFRYARGRYIALIDGDQQNDPRDLPRLLAKAREGYDVVSGWRVKRRDNMALRRIPSMLANRLISRITKTKLHDYGCTLKVYDADVVRHVHLYGELHRFIPALAGMVGARVAELPVNHRARTRGKSKYGINRTIRVLLDLLTVKFLLKYLSRPMQFFGLLGVTSAIFGFSSFLYLLYDRFVLGNGIGNRPALVIAVVLIILGVQFISMGLLGELLTRIYHEGSKRAPYVIRLTAGVESDTETDVDPVQVLRGGGEARPVDGSVDLTEDRLTLVEVNGLLSQDVARSTGLP